jgi:DNA-directed RNA polymerase subunit H (RpoH/RPB5)
MDILYKENPYINSINIILTKFLPFRKLTLIENEHIKKSIVDAYNIDNDEDNDIPKPKELIEFNDMALNLIKNNGYIQITAENSVPRGARNIVYILILSNDDNGDIKKNKILKKNIDTIDKYDLLDELIIITDEIQFGKKAFIDCIVGLKQNESKNFGSMGSAIYNAYPSKFFRCDIPNIVNIYSHRIISDEEIIKELASEYISIANIPTIYTYDPIIVWIGGRPDDVVEIIRNSQTIESVYYRYVKYEIYKPEKIIAKLKR